MARLVCGRCGRYTAVNSTYCPHDQWAILVDLPTAEQPGGPLFDFELPQGSGFLARRRQESHRDHLERAYRENLERRNDALEKRLSTDPENPQILRALGLIAYLEGQLERANALWERAHKLAPDDLETAVNYAIALARRGQLQPALTVLSAARQKAPDQPPVLINLALVALQARRPEIVYQAVGALEKLWAGNEGLKRELHDIGVTARGLALLQENKAREARRELTIAARRTLNLAPDAEDIGDDFVLPVAPNAAAGQSASPNSLEQANLLNNLALAEVSLGHLDRAHKRLKTALSAEPGHIQVLNNLGTLAYRQGNLRAAFRYLDVARQIQEFQNLTDPYTWNHLGVVSSAMGDVEKSLEYFRHAGATEHAEVEIYYNLGRSLIEHGQADQGAVQLRHAFSLEPNNPDVHTVLSAAYLFSGKLNLYGEALKHLKRAIQIDSHHRMAAVNLILGLLIINNVGAAKGLLGQALKLFPGEGELQYLAALISLEESQHDDEQAQVFWADAAQKFESVIATRPEIIAALYNTALCQFMMGFRDASAKMLEASVKRDPSFGAAYYLIGYGHATAKRDAEALQAWSMALKFEAANADLHANIGALLYRKADYANATRSYMQAHRLVPNDAMLLAQLGLCFAQQKLFPQAISTFQQSVALDPKSPIIHSNLGLALYLFNQVESAMIHWRTVSRLDSSYAERREKDQQEGRFDESIIQLQSLRWRDRVVKMAPVLPRSHTRLVPAHGTDPYQLAISDPNLQAIVRAKRETEHATRILATMSLKI